MCCGDALGYAAATSPPLRAVTVEIRKADGEIAVSFCELRAPRRMPGMLALCFKKATCTSVAGEVIE
jgi:hypothetical protein